MRFGSARLLVGYLTLLVLSHFWGNLGEPQESSALFRAVVSEVNRGEDMVSEVSLAYLDLPVLEATPPTSPVVLLHGSPGSQDDFGSLAPLLGTQYRVIAPDLPGFGGSTRRIADYSIRAHAHYVLQLLDRLAIPQVHLVGFSMGGGVALELIGLDPDRVKSLTLLSSIGLQEFELLGSYPLNHAIHAVQLGAVWALHRLVPHFGLFDQSILNVPYARNFYDSDQRPLRAIIGRLQQPTLILHGEKDSLVPVEAALEHHRLVPQSEIVLFADDHFMLFRDTRQLALPILDFIGRVESGQGRTRSDATPDRQAEAARVPNVSDLRKPARGLSLVILVCLIAAATLISEDLTCVAAGILVAQGRMGFLAATTACFTGILFGDLLLYGVGRYLGGSALRRVPMKWILSPEKLRRGSEWLERRGPIVVILSRFLPGTRLGTYLAAGLLRMKFRRFVGYFVVAVALWTPLVVGLSSSLGGRAYDLIEAFSQYALLGFVVAFASVWAVVRLIPRLLTYRGRRLLVGVWGRVMHWEFWPVWLLYIPVVVWIFWLGIRNGSFTVFTAANPAMPEGGFTGESKADILNSLDPQAIAKFARVGVALSIEARIVTVVKFMADHGLSCPIVLKPDVGQRGRGVAIVHSTREIAAFCVATQEDFLVQEFIGGAEFGVFYYRFPGEERGRVFSMTRKIFPVVTGDGETSLENLILADERAVKMATTYFRRFESDLARVPAIAEKVRLVDVGTHRLGADFVDAAAYLTDEFEDEVDRLACQYSGFFFGRFDVRFPNFDGTRLDRNFKILELNGVTSEATHIYDPKIGLIDAYKALFEQWSIAFNIGKANMERGAQVTSLRELLRGVTVDFLG